jgi:hypothetical protein
MPLSRCGKGRPRVNEDKVQRTQRLAAALRANLRRRKQPARRQPRAQDHDANEPNEAESGKPDMDRPPGKT